jgi:linoleoyl-CoA desaturase
MKEATMTLPTQPLSREQADAFGRELDELKREVVASLGQRDVDHIRGVIRAANRSEAVGRLLLGLGYDPVTFGAGVAALTLAKILENMEIGHNVMHGQYDWTHDPALDSRTYEWDNVCTGDNWRHFHNYEHHTFTNVLGRDRDVGYSFLRVFPEQPWQPLHLIQPGVAVALALLFQWGVGMHDLHVDELLTGRFSLREWWIKARPFVAKARWQLAKDYVFYPALAPWNVPRVLVGNLLANVLRNLWTFVVIFCGHFPDGVRLYQPEEARDESRGQWYLRQLNGSANIEGGRWLHVLTGHLSHQIEHHLFPDLPAARYPELAPRVREICARYGQTYCTGTLARQFGSVARRIVRYALPSRNARGARAGEAAALT